MKHQLPKICQVQKLNHKHQEGFGWCLWHLLEEEKVDDLSPSLLPDLRSPRVWQAMGTQSLCYLLVIRQNWGEKQSYLCDENVPDLSPA